MAHILVIGSLTLSQETPVTLGLHQDLRLRVPESRSWSSRTCF